MDLMINSPGSYLKKQNDMFEISSDDVKRKTSPKKIKSIIISTHVMLTSDAIKLAVENNIDILILNDFGDPVGRFWHGKFGSTAFIRRKQIEILETEKGLDLAKKWITNKIQTSINHITELGYKRKSKQEEINYYIEEMNGCISFIKGVKGKVPDKRNTIMAYEGKASKLYYQIISKLIPDPYKFQGRSYRPAKDEYNSMLNYAFGILYGKVEKSCIIAGLDPYIGILHTDNYNKISLVLDMIENYRYLAWKSVFRLFSQKKVNKSHFDKIHGGFKLNADGKKLLATDFLDELNKKTVYKNKRLTNLEVIQMDCHKLSNYLIGK
jgi:CRISPR-associated protein Cas1